VALTDYSRDDIKQCNILESLLWQERFKCAGIDSPCAQAFDSDDNYITYDFIWNNLPAVAYVINSKVSYIFSARLTTGDEAQDKILEEYLQSENVQGAVNFEELKTAVRYMLLYGQAGVRFLSKDDGWLYVNPKSFEPAVLEDERYWGVYKTLFYIINRGFSESNYKGIDVDDAYVDLDNEIEDGYPIVEIANKGNVLSDDENFIYVDDKLFINLREDTSLLNGKSRYDNDRQRLQLVATILDRLIHDLSTGGIGRVLFQLKDTLFNQNGIIDGEMSSEAFLESISTGSININQTNFSSNSTDLQDSIRSFAEAFSGNDEKPVFIPSILEKDPVRLENVVKSTDFIEWLQDQCEKLAAQLQDLDPILLGLGSLSGNVSTTTIFDNAYKYVFEPMRRKIAEQISPLLEEQLGIGPVRFVTEEDTPSPLDRLYLLRGYNELLEAGATEFAEEFRQRYLEGIVFD